MSIIGKIFDKQFEKYLNDLNEHMLHMIKSEKNKYILKRKNNLNVKLKQIKYD